MVFRGVSFSDPDKLEKEKPHVLAAIEGKMTVPENGAVAEAK